MAKIWIDILTPKQALFFKPLIIRLRNLNHVLYITTRKYPQATEMLNQLGLDAKVYGSHGGRELKEKLRADANRILDLIDPIASFNPDLAISFVSPTAARVAFGIGLPMICISDSPHARAVSTLTIPFASRLLSPDLIDKQEWVRYGIPEENIVQYHAVDQMAWTQNVTPSEAVLTELGLVITRPIVTIRAEESYAAYLLDRTQQDYSPIIPVVKNLLKRFPNVQIVVLPRYPQQFRFLKDSLPQEVIIPDQIIDGLSLLTHSTLFVGAGGTMTTEAVLLGIPAISFYNGTLDIEEWLRKRNILQKAASVEMVIDYASQVLADPIKYHEKAKRNAESLRNEFEDPITKIIEVIDEVLTVKK